MPQCIVHRHRSAFGNTASAPRRQAVWCLELAGWRSEEGLGKGNAFEFERACQDSLRGTAGQVPMQAHQACFTRLSLRSASFPGVCIQPMHYCYMVLSAIENSGLTRLQESLGSNCRLCALDNAFSTRVPCQLIPATAAPNEEQHCCTVNFNADGTLWACVPASCLLTACTTANFAHGTQTRICNELAEQLKSVARWISGKADCATVSDAKVHL